MQGVTASPPHQPTLTQDQPTAALQLEPEEAYFLGSDDAPSARLLAAAGETQTDQAAADARRACRECNQNCTYQPSSNSHALHFANRQPRPDAEARACLFESCVQPQLCPVAHAFLYRLARHHSQGPEGPGAAGGLPALIPQATQLRLALQRVLCSGRVQACLNHTAAEQQTCWRELDEEGACDPWVPPLVGCQDCLRTAFQNHVQVQHTADLVWKSLEGCAQSAEGPDRVAPVCRGGHGVLAIRSFVLSLQGAGLMPNTCPPAQFYAGLERFVAGTGGGRSPLVPSR